MLRLSLNSTFKENYQQITSVKTFKDITDKNIFIDDYEISVVGKLLPTSLLIMHYKEIFP